MIENHNFVFNAACYVDFYDKTKYYVMINLV